MIKKSEILHFRVTPQELERIKLKKSELGIISMTAYLRKMALDGYCVNMDISEIKNISTLLSKCGNNLNQYAKIANRIDSIYATDIKDLQIRLDEICDLQRKLLKKLSSIK